MPPSHPILVVDDDPAALESLQLLLSRHWPVRTAASAAEARAALKREEIAVIVSDQRMAGETGVELLRWAAQHHPEVVRILLTGAISSAGLSQAINEAQIWYYLPKPWDNHQLLHLVKRAIEHRRERRKVAIMDARARALLRGAPIGVAELSRAGRIQEANAAFARVIGEPAATGLHGESILRWLANPEVWKALVAELDLSSEVVGLEASLRSSSGDERQTVLNARLHLEDNGDRTVQLFVQDLTELRRTRGELDVARLMLERLHREGLVGRLAATTVHDINNLLTVILSQASYVRSDMGVSEEARECLRDVELSAREIDGLIGQLMTLLRGEHGGDGLADPAAIAQAAARLTRGMRLGPAAVRVEIGDDPPLVRIARGRLLHALLNLCTNAVAAMPEGGRLTLAVDQGPVLPGQRTPSARLTITDTGRGIPAERLANLFTAYETTGGADGARRRSGTGLGLLVVKKLVEDAGGTIEVHSRLGVGTTFTLCLPADEEDEAETLDLPPMPTPFGQPGVGHILVIDDDEAVRILAQQGLGALGYQVRVAGLGREALAQVSAHGRFDLVLLDLELPDIHGEQLFDDLRARVPDQQILVGSGHPLTPRLAEALRHSPTRLLRKPFSLRSLADAVQGCLAAEAERLSGS